MYDCYFTNVLTQRSCFEVLLSVLTAGSLCFTPDDARTFVPTIPRRRRAFTVNWNIEVFVHSNSASGVVVFFFTRRPRQQFPLPANLHRHSRHTHFQQDETSSLLDRRRHESRQTYRSYQLMLHLGTSTKLFPAIWTRTARSTEELFSQWRRPKRASSDQRTDEEDTSETCNNNHVGGRTVTNAKKRNWGRTYIYVLGHRDGRFGDVYIRPVAVNGLKVKLYQSKFSMWEKKYLLICFSGFSRGTIGTIYDIFGHLVFHGWVIEGKQEEQQKKTTLSFYLRTLRGFHQSLHFRDDPEEDVKQSTRALSSEKKNVQAGLRGET